MGPFLKGSWRLNISTTIFVLSCRLADKFGPAIKDQNIAYRDPDQSDRWIEDIDIAEFLKLILDIDTSKASGFPEINSKLLKEALLTLKVDFTRILNMCLEQCRFPDSWKTATVVIPKKGDTKAVTNLRRISLLPAPGKILERIMNKYLVDVLESEGILAKEQMGFCKEQSTVEGCFSLIKLI